MNSDYRILKLRSGEEIIAKVVGQNKKAMVLERPFMFKNSMIVDGFGRRREITVLKNWLANSKQIRTEIPKNHIASFLDPDDDVSVLYDIEKEREDTNQRKRSVGTSDSLFPHTDLEDLDMEDFNPNDLKEILENLAPSPDEIKEKVDGKIKDMLDSIEKNYNKDMSSEYNDGFPPDEQEYIMMNMLFPPKMLKDMIDRGLINLNDFSKLLDDDMKIKPNQDNGEGFDQDYTGDESNREDFGNKYTDWSWDLRDYVDSDIENEKDDRED